MSKNRDAEEHLNGKEPLAATHNEYGRIYPA